VCRGPIDALIRQAPNVVFAVPGFKRGLCCRAMAGWLTSRSYIVSKRLKIRPQLLWNENRKRVPKISNGTIFNDLE